MSGEGKNGVERVGEVPLLGHINVDGLRLFFKWREGKWDKCLKSKYQ